MFKYYFTAVLIVCLVLEVHLLSGSCQNAFQNILQTHQQPGKFPRDGAIKLLGTRVISRMECLDICLRNAMCDFFDMKKVRFENATKHWICSIKQRLYPTDTKPLKANWWFHFNVSSHKLQEVSSLDCDILCRSSACDSFHTHGFHMHV